MKARLSLFATLGITAAIAAAFGTVALLFTRVAVAGAVEGAAAAAATDPEALGTGLVAAAAATAASSLAAGYAVGKVGVAAIGALVEKPELMARLLIFVGLAEGIAIYGLIVSILILNRLA